MAVVIRLTQMGKKGERKFRIAVKEKRSKRDGGAIEYLGWYEKTENSHKKNINMDRFNYWISKGAQASPTVTKLVEQA
ncbi:MAG: 30S ribosomal protein S16 [Candidatus Levybacteria bacterium]|nr:30S ribosomal protein S16 [Candidatus Levybacteria bacterium]